MNKLFLLLLCGLSLGIQSASASAQQEVQQERTLLCESSAAISPKSTEEVKAKGKVDQFCLAHNSDQLAADITNSNFDGMSDAFEELNSIIESLNNLLITPQMNANQKEYQEYYALQKSASDLQRLFIF